MAEGGGGGGRAPKLLGTLLTASLKLSGKCLNICDEGGVNALGPYVSKRTGQSGDSMKRIPIC